MYQDIDFMTITDTLVLWTNEIGLFFLFSP